MWSFFSRDAAKDFPYELGSEVDFSKEYSIWRLHHGKKKSSGEQVSIFAFEVSNSESQTLFDIAKSALKRIKTLRHPSTLTYVDSLETDKIIYLVVEPVEPLELYISKSVGNQEQKQLAISWGLYQIASGLTFLNKDCQLAHHNVCMSSVYVDRAGEWKLFGFEYMTQWKECSPIKVLPALKIYDPPEHEAPQQEECPPWAYDSWGLGCLIWEVFNGKLIKISSLKSTGKIPASLATFYCELVCANPKSRPSSSTFLKKASRGNSFLKNKFVDTMLFLREIHIKENDEKLKFFDSLSSSLDTFPQDVCIYRILPELVNAFEFGNAGSSVLTPLFKLGKFLSDEEYQKKIVPCVVKMFSSKDRTTRVKLLQQVEEFIDHIQSSVINSQIFPNVAQGFSDTNPAIRDHTIKCMIYLAPKLNYQNLNEEMLKHFARLQSKDEQGGIRTNATVCLGKIASCLHPQTRKKVLINAFLRALRDPFPPARTAAILALSATEQYYSINDCATRVLPALCHFTVDSEKTIRDQSFKAIGGFLSKLEQVSEDPSLKEKMEEELQTTSTASIAASWTSWAVTSLADKLYKSTSKSQTLVADEVRNVSSKTNEYTEKSPEKLQPSNDDQNLSSWDNDDWGEEKNVSLKQNEVLASSTLDENKDANDWEEEWENFEIDDNFSKNAETLKSYFPGDQDDPFSPLQNKVIDNKNLKLSKESESWDSHDNWNSWETDQINEDEPFERKEPASQKQEAARLLREEKRRLRLKERQLARPKKLGAQKIS